MRHTRTTIHLRQLPITTALFTRAARIHAWFWALDPWEVGAAVILAAAVVLVLVVSTAAAHTRQAAAAPTQQPIILVEHATPAPTPTAPARPILGRWDYQNPASAALVSSAD